MVSNMKDSWYVEYYRLANWLLANGHANLYDEANRYNKKYFENKEGEV